MNKQTYSIQLQLQWREMKVTLIVTKDESPVVITPEQAEEALYRRSMADARRRRLEAGEHDPLTTPTKEPRFYGYCEGCDRSAGGWLGAGLGFFGSPKPTCNYCMGKHMTTGQKSPGLAKTLVKEILDSGWCWHCRADIDEQLLDHECDEDDCQYDAVSVGQRRFCAECAYTLPVIPTTDLVGIAIRVWDPTGTLDYYRVSK